MPETSQVRFADSKSSVLLDAVRAGAAVLVLLEHWRNLFFVDFGELHGAHFAWTLPYALSGVGHQAVILFFLLSGYFIGGSVMQATARGRWSWSDYLLKRIVRLWIVLLPSLALCAVWDRAGLAMGRAPLLYGGVLHPTFIAAVADRLGLRTLLANVAFLQTIVAPTFGSDGALWSLAYEFWYYLLFPLAYFGLRRGTRPTVRALCFVLFAAVAWMVRGEILLYFAIWLAGVALHWLPTQRNPLAAGGRARAWTGAGCVAFLGLFLLLGKTRALSLHVSDGLVALLSWMLLAGLLRWRQAPAEDTFATRVSRTWARFSYSLYTLHTPVLVFLVALVLGDKRWQPSLKHGLVATACLAATVAYSYAVARWTEFRTDAVRGWLERRLGLRRMA